MQKYYTVYKITNNKSNKIYIGMHETYDLDDGYMGSGRYIKSAIRKYGKENFTKEILKVFDTREEMIQYEKDIIEGLNSHSYNLKPGGVGGWFVYKDGAMQPLSQLPETIRKRKLTQKEANEKRCITSKERYGASNISQCNDIKVTKSKTYLRNFGAEHITQTDHFKNKKRENCLALHGVEFHSQIEEVKNRGMETQLRKYGMHYSKTDEYKKRVKETRAKNPELQRPRRNTKMGNYYDALLRGEGVKNDVTNPVFYLRRNFNIKIEKRVDGLWYLAL